jgi:hypothetical protein
MIMRIKIVSVSWILFILAVATLNILALDLKFNSGISKSPGTFNAGDVVTFTVSFTSQDGTVTNFKIIGGVDTTQIYERVFASIPDGANRQGSFTWTAVAGSHTAWFELDPDHVNGDSDYSNNRIELTLGSNAKFKINPAILYTNFVALKPDLLITQVSLKKEPSMTNIYSFSVTFKNQGKVCVKAFNWKIANDLCTNCPQGSYSAEEPLCALNPGQEKTSNGFISKLDFSSVLKEKCGGSLYSPKYKRLNRVYFVVDWDGKVDESKETNNTTAMQELVWEDECAVVSLYQ